jgi:uncharacterized membrane protein YdjX (TVP38/TMEM64 family)
MYLPGGHATWRVLVLSQGVICGLLLGVFLAINMALIGTSVSFWLEKRLTSRF